MLYFLYRKEICKYESEMPNVWSRFYNREEKRKEKKKAHGYIISLCSIK